MLRLDEHWIWDFWFARDGADYHVYYLKAPRSLGDPDLRHWHASIGHAVSRDLRHWEVAPDALHPGAPGSFDDLATWTGSVFSFAGRHYLYYTGLNRSEDGRVQRIGLAVSDDLTHWERVAAGNPLVEADARWYELLDEPAGRAEDWRDPWVFQDPASGEFRMLVTARGRGGAPDGRGVIGQARSSDLLEWEVMAPLTEPGEFDHMECPQLVSVSGRSYLLFSVCGWAHSRARMGRVAPVHGTHYLVGDSPAGPFGSLTDTFLCGTPHGPLYAGKLVDEPDGTLVFLAFENHDTQGRFVGGLADPIPVKVLPDGRLELDG